MTENSHSGRILVAEDDAVFRQLLCRVLENSKYSLVEAGSGEEVLAKVETEIPDLIILDLHFSGIDGFTVCRMIRERYPTVFLPIIVLSGDGAASEHRVQGIEAGAYDFLPKPVRRQELLAKVESFLKMKRLHEAVEWERLKLLALNQKQESTIHNQQENLKLLGRFFSPQVADMLLKTKSPNVVNHHKCQITVCFIDLRGFTAFAEATDLDTVIGLISAYYEIVCKLALKYGGTISSLAGDGIMIFFNDPVPLEHHTAAALDFLFDVRRDLGIYTDFWQQKKYTLGFGAGMAEGEAIVGAVGFDQFMHYTAIGTTVNLAARLCKEAQVGQVLATQRGLRNVENLVECEPVGVFKLKGIEVEVSAVNLIGWRTGNLP